MTDDMQQEYRPRVPLAGKRVLAAMSGGVDSSVVASMLLEAGAEVVGITFRNFRFAASKAPSPRSCCAKMAAADAQAVCGMLGIRHVIVNETKRFTDEVIQNFEDEYHAGRTPNPCVRCNVAVRYPVLLEEAEKLGCDYVATGHYARFRSFTDAEGATSLRLTRGVDDNKDQSYFLAAVDPAHYGKILFPLGEFRKPWTRARAVGIGLHVHDRVESQDICFLGGDSLREYLAERDLLSPGEIVDMRGDKLGDHDGVELYTIGQRRGLGVAMGKPVFVTAIDPQTGHVVLGDESDLDARRLTCRDVWIHDELQGEAVAVEGLTARIRYRSRGCAVETVTFRDGQLEVIFAEPVSAAAPGQSLVLYRDECVLGHGIIESAENL
ncbi:MAG: tRNA 2-thiouridine(34) synthase MnmA [bacterium]|nr:tRNA 2-thiouridine(34) synthase MnmA [bacterium]